MFAGAQAVHAAEEVAHLSLAVVGTGSAAAGTTPAGGWLDESPAPGLRVERKFNLLAAKKVEEQPQGSRFLRKQLPRAAEPVKEEDHPVFLTADHLEGRTDDVMEAEGNVEYRKVGALLLADKLTYWPLDDEVEAVGNVRLQQDRDEISGPYMRMKMSEQIGVFDDADYRFAKDVQADVFRRNFLRTRDVAINSSSSGTPLMLNVPVEVGLQEALPPRRTSVSYGHARRINFEGENQVRLEEATYSTCKPGETDWYLKGEEVRLDYDEEVGQAKDAKVYFQDVPFFYMPAGSFSLNHNRRSGLLPGTFSASTKNGLDVIAPVYWNIAPNYDATFYPRYMSKRGFQLGTEARYKDYFGVAEARVEYLPEDQIANRERYAYSFKDTHVLGRGFNVAVNWNGVSDDRYWEDLSSRLIHTTSSQLPKQVTFGYSPGDWWSSSLAFQRFQTLQTSSATRVARPYFIEPQLGFSGRLLDVLGFGDVSLFAQYTNFTHPDKIEGGRVVAYPQIALPYVTPGFIFIPKFGIHATQYELNRVAAGQPDSLSRVLPIFTLDSSLIFERPMEWQGRDYLQTLEPRLYYTYIPYKDQSRIPVFDSAIGDFNFSQIFTENRYIGADRINDANQLTAALTTRLLDSQTGAENFKAMIGQRYYFQRQRVTITDETARTDNFSNFLAAFSGLILPKTYLDAAWEYNYHKSQNERLSAGVRYQPESAKVLSAGYRFTRDALGVGQVDQIDIAGQWPLDNRWYAVGRYNYSLRDKQLLEAIGGVEYNAGCWAARFVVQRLEALGGSPNTTFFFQLELNDFASVGSNPIQLLRRTIPGYGKVNEIPTTGSLITTE